MPVSGSSSQLHPAVGSPCWIEVCAVLFIFVTWSCQVRLGGERERQDHRVPDCGRTMKLARGGGRVYSMLSCLLALIAFTFVHVLVLIVSPSIYRLVSSRAATRAFEHKVGVRSAEPHTAMVLRQATATRASGTSLSGANNLRLSRQLQDNVNSSALGESHTGDHPVANFEFDDFEDATAENDSTASDALADKQHDGPVRSGISEVISSDPFRASNSNVSRETGSVSEGSRPGAQSRDTGHPQSLPGVVEPGVNVKVPSLEVHVLSALTSPRHGEGKKEGGKPAQRTVFLTTWTDERYRQKGEMKVSFVCCFPSSRPTAASLVSSRVVSVTYALKYPRVNMTYTEYQCDVSSEGQEGLLAFGYQNCTAEVSPFLRVELATPHSDLRSEATPNVSICLPALYGDVPLMELIEWIELHRLVGVTQIHVHYFNVSEGTLTVLRHYEKEGLVTFRPFTLARRAGDPPRGFERPRLYDEQAWMDAWVNLNDCRRRLATFTFVLVLDYDELLVPTLPHKTLNEAFKAALQQFPDAAYFLGHSHIHLTDWGRSYNDTDLFFLTHLQMTKSNMLDSKGRGRSSPKTFFSPARMIRAQRLNGQPMKKYQRYQLPSSIAVMHHYRSCKLIKWGKACWDWERETPSRLLDLQAGWEAEVTRVKKLLDLR